MRKSKGLLKKLEISISRPAGTEKNSRSLSMFIVYDTVEGSVPTLDLIGLLTRWDGWKLRSEARQDGENLHSYTNWDALKSCKG